MQTAKRCALYRHYDDADTLLYVGISEVLVSRGKQHATDSTWVKYAARAEAVWYPSRTEAEAAERAAITSEHPIFNRRHNDTPSARWRRTIYLGERGDLPTGPKCRYHRPKPMTNQDLDTSRGYTLSELLAMDADDEGDWGPWVLCSTHRVLEYHDEATRNAIYEVDLEDCTSSAGALDWVMQVSGKGWPAEVVGGLVSAIADIIDPQANLCPFGSDQRMPREQVAKMIDAAAGRYPELDQDASLVAAPA